MNASVTASTTNRRTATGHRVSGRQTFSTVLHAEWIKLISLRSTWVTSAIAVGLTVLVGAGMAIALSHTPDYVDNAKDSLASGAAFGQIVVAVLGALIITGEYSSGQIRSTVTAVPRRNRCMAAKVLIVTVWSFLLGALSILIAWAVSAPFMDGHAGSLTDMKYLGYVWGTGVSFVVIALMAMGLGFLLRSTSGAITTVVCLLFIVTIPLGIMSAQWVWAREALGVFPLTDAAAVADPFSLSNKWGVPETPNFLTHVQAALVFLAWGLVPLAAGWMSFLRRDV